MVRTKYEIYLEILDVSKVAVGKTSIVYRCNLNFNTVKRYLKSLIKSGLIAEIRSKKKTIYQTTKEGENYLTILKKVLI